MKLNSRFDAELLELQQALEAMMSLDLDCLHTIADAIEDQRLTKVIRVRKLAQEIDRSERMIESLCLRLLLTRHPVASDLRRISGTLKMITDLQRIGHQCRDFADILVEDGGPLKIYLPRLSKIAQLVIAMFKGAIDACAHANASAAHNVMLADNEIDAEYAQLRGILADEIRNPTQLGTDRLLDVLMLGKYLERMADHVVLFARWIIFTVNGDRVAAEEEELLEKIEQNDCNADVK